MKSGRGLAEDYPPSRGPRASALCTADSMHKISRVLLQTHTGCKQDEAMTALYLSISTLLYSRQMVWQGGGGYNET